jgi:hypothetical protein
MADEIGGIASPWGAPGADWVKLETVPFPPALEAPPHTQINPCFAAGTRLLTENGDLPVEDIRPGDHAITHENELAKIIWIGRRDLDFLKHPMPALVRPVRIAAGALGMGIPERELVVSPDHGLYFDGCLVQARDIVDGVVIRFDTDMPAIRYYHVELENHGILLAEGAPVESYLDTGHRGVFGNAELPVILPPDLMQARREADSAAPLVTGGEELAGIRARLHARKLMLGLAPAEARVFALKCGEALLQPVENLPGRVSFALPDGVTEPVFCSAVFVPAEMDPFSDDRRRLGVAISEILLDGHTVPLERVIRPAELHRRAPRETATWTSGATRLTVPLGAKIITFNLAAVPRIWRNIRARHVETA